MSVYDEKEAKLSEAFTHLVQDSSDESDEDKVKATAAADASTDSDVHCKIVKEVKPFNIEENQHVDQIDILDVDDEDCEIVPPEDDVIEVLESKLKLKLQDGHRKHNKELSISKCDTVVRIKEFWSKEYNLDISAIKLCFDGDLLCDEATLEECDIDDGCLIDVMVTQSK